MGKKHAKKRFFCVKYIFKADRKFDEFVELTKKKIGIGKMLEYTVVLDLVNEKILKNDLPGIPVAERDNITYSRMLDHYKRWYNEAINTFLNS
jgi:hypothetical protein